MKWLPSFGLGLERKAAADRRAAAGPNFVFAGQPYLSDWDVDRVVRDGYAKVIWVYKGIDATATKIASWPINVMEGEAPDWREVEDPIKLLLNTYANTTERSSMLFRYRLVSQMILSKKGVFIEAIPSRGGGLAALNLLPPGRTNPIADPDRFVSGFEVTLADGEKAPLKPYDPQRRSGVIWLRKPHPTDPYSSVTPLEAAGISIDLDFYGRLYNRNFLLNDGRAGQLIAVKGGLTPADAAMLQARFSPGIGGAGRTSVIEAESIDVKDTAVTPRDAQYAELRNITKEDLLIALGTPESVIGNASGRTFDNADAEKENWLDVTCLPLAQVISAGLDVLTEGGYDDDRHVVHDVSGEPVLRRAAEARIERARADQAAGRITIYEWRDMASREGLALDRLDRPGTRVLWIPSGMIAVGDAEDEQQASELVSAGQPQPPVPPSPPSLLDGTMPLGGPVIEGQVVEDPAIGTPQREPQALEAAAAQLELETKRFNPQQPRYPSGHPKGGQWLDAGDTALWLAGKPLKDGTPASAVQNPNPGSTASPAAAPGGAGAATRFAGAPPAVQVAAAVMTPPANYPYPRVLGAPVATPVKGGPKPIKAVSLRPGDVILDTQGKVRTVVRGGRADGQGGFEVDTVDANGLAFSLLFLSPQDTIRAEARTPHPTVVADAKRTLSTYANSGAAPATPGAVAASFAAATAPPPRIAPPPPAAANIGLPTPTPRTATPPAAGPPPLPLPPRNATVYAHTSGKHIYIDPAGGLPQVFLPSGRKGTSSSAGKLAAGQQVRGWSQVPAPPGWVRDPNARLGWSRTNSMAGQQAAAPTPPMLNAPPPPQQPAAAQAATPPPPAPAPPSPAHTASAASTVVRAGVPRQTITSAWRQDPTFTNRGSNPAAPLIDPSGTKFYVKSQDAKHADNEVAANRIYRAAGVQVPTVSRAQIATGSFPGQSGTDGIASEIIPGTDDMTAKMRRDSTYRDAVLEDFVVHAWLGNWDAVENNNTNTGTNGRPQTIDVGGSLMFRARGGARKLDRTVLELQSMRTGSTAGSSAKAAFGQLKPDSTDPRFVAGVRRVLAISDSDLDAIVDSSMPSFSQRERDELKQVLKDRRAHLAREAGVAATPTPAPAAPAAPNPLLTFPPNYPWSQVPGAPVATALPRPKQIKVASLRRGDVYRDAGTDYTVVSVTKARGGGVALSGVALNGNSHSSTYGSPQATVTAVARTPHPTLVAQARRQQTGAPATPAPTGPVAPSPNTPTVGQAGPFTPDANSKMPPGVYESAISRMTVDVNGDAIIEDISGPNRRGSAVQASAVTVALTSPTAGPLWTYQGAPAAPAAGPVTLAQVASLPAGSVLRYSGPQSSLQGDTIELDGAGRGTLITAAGIRMPMNPNVLTQYVNTGDYSLAQTGPTPTPPAPTAPTPGPVPFPRGGWAAAGQAVPGAVFTNGQGSTLTVGPRGGGKLTAGGSTRNMSAQALNSALTRQSIWSLAQPGPTAPALGNGNVQTVTAPPAQATHLPPVGTPTQGTPPAGAVYPPAATGQVLPTPVGQVTRGQTARVGGEDWVLTETIHLGSGRYELWGYRPGIDDPNTVTQDPATKAWRQGAQIPGVSGRGTSVDIVGPAPQTAANVPSGGRPRQQNAALGTPLSTPNVAHAVPGVTPYAFVSQTVPATDLKPGDVILLNGQEGRGSFVVTGIAPGPNGKPMVHGYSGTEFDATGQAGAPTPTPLFRTDSRGTPREVRVQVDGGAAVVPDVPRPMPPTAAGGIIRLPISGQGAQQRLRDIWNGPPPRLRQLPNVTSVGDTRQGHMNELRGFNGHPDVVTEAELDAYVAAGEIELYRGMTNAGGVDVAEEYRTGKHYPGGGSGTQFGTGTYTAYGAKATGSELHLGGKKYTTGLDFSKGAYTGQQNYGNRGQGVMVRMSLKADARVAEFDELKNELRREATAARRSDPDYAMLMEMLNGGDTNITHYAVWKGYDAVRVGGAYRHGTNGKPVKKPGDWEAGFVVVLNRSAVRVSNKNYVAPSNVRSAPGGSNPPPVSWNSLKVTMTTRHKHAAGVDYKIAGIP